MFGAEGCSLCCEQEGGKVRNHHFGLYFNSWAVEVRVLCSKQLVKAESF